jgi:hypothetical protein
MTALGCGLRVVHRWIVIRSLLMVLAWANT